MTYGGRTREVYYPPFGRMEPTSIRKTEIACVPPPPSKSENSNKVTEEQVNGALRNAMSEIARNFKRQKGCIESAATQPFDRLILSADTGIYMQRVHGDWAVIADKHTGTKHRMPAGNKWEFTVGADVVPGTVYEACIQFSEQQPYPNRDAILRLDILPPIST